MQRVVILQKNKEIRLIYGQIEAQIQNLHGEMVFDSNDEKFVQQVFFFIIFVNFCYFFVFFC